VSELQRKSFKDDPHNKGKLFTGGLFALAHHINYFGYLVWRTGLALASGSIFWGVFMGLFILYDFQSRGVPVLQEYMKSHYGEQFVKYQKSTAKFFPFLW